jgi:hypothetical protein
MINFAEIQDNIEHLQTREQAMAAILSRLETTVATLCASSRVDEMEQRFKDTFEQQHRALERLDVAQQIAAKVVEEMPTIQRDLMAKLAEVEQTGAVKLSELSEKLGSRLTRCELEVRQKAMDKDLQQLSAALNDCSKKEEVDKMQMTLIKVRDEVSLRIDSVGESTNKMRKELDTGLEAITATSEAITKQVSERTKKLEEESAQLQTFVSKAERALASKVSAELNAVKTAFAAQLEETRNVLRSQLDIARAKAESALNELTKVSVVLQSVAGQEEMDKLKNAISSVQASAIKFEESLKAKADMEPVEARLTDLLIEQKATRADLSTKADEAAVNVKIQGVVSASSGELIKLRDSTGTLQVSVTALEQAMVLMSHQTQQKADQREVGELRTVNEAISERVGALKEELQGMMTHDCLSR